MSLCSIPAHCHLNWEGIRSQERNRGKELGMNKLRNEKSREIWLSYASSGKHSCQPEEEMRRRLQRSGQLTASSLHNHRFFIFYLLSNVDSSDITWDLMVCLNYYWYIFQDRNSQARPAQKASVLVPTILYCTILLRQ